MRGVILGVLTASLIFACACMNKPVQADTVPEVHPDPVMVPYTGMTVEQFQNVTEYRKAQLSEEDATFSETCTNTLEAVGTFEPAYEEPEPELIDLGAWTISFYCPCEICCGQWATGCTASGVLATEWHTIATDQFEFGTQLFIDGLGYFTVEDRGVEGEWIDVFVNDHQQALDLGIQTREVYLIND